MSSDVGVPEYDLHRTVTPTRVDLEGLGFLLSKRRATPPKGPGNAPVQTLSWGIPVNRGCRLPFRGRENQAASAARTGPWLSQRRTPGLRGRDLYYSFSAHLSLFLDTFEIQCKGSRL
ncbi:hypothetical protein NDU88_002069 [Pleurodeles waltl]|uniref:Uncharacterized protein n=1 Tax=Pleurodeles waltl TaxID=8319 RepID=A0AAV7KRR7_PLEWA|nr:hypothetical protein NDU88_002069 [Pleurodeles waltl]